MTLHCQATMPSVSSSLTRRTNRMVLWSSLTVAVWLISLLLPTTTVPVHALARGETKNRDNCIIDANGNTVCLPREVYYDHDVFEEDSGEVEEEEEEEEEEEVKEDGDISDEEDAPVHVDSDPEENEDSDKEKEEGTRFGENFRNLFPEKEDDCVDDVKSEPNCPHYVNDNTACIENYDSASLYCRASCMFCHNVEELPPDDEEEKATIYVHNIYSEKAPQLISNHVQVITQQDEEMVKLRIQASDDYMYETVYREAKYDKVKADCQNLNSYCTIWATFGECESNAPYMQLNCAPACMSCDKFIFEVRCPYDANVPGIWSQPGDLHAMFRRIATDPVYEPYKPLVLSAPGSFPSDLRRRFVTPQDQLEWNATLEVAASSPKTKDGPWVLVLDDFLTPQECDFLIQAGAAMGYELSADVGELRPDGTYGDMISPDRTSTNAWCLDDCYDEPTVQTILKRLENMTQIPERNYEYLQMLRYEVGQFYGVHHDYIPHQINRAEGVRILTLFIYLNNVEAGGGTNFPQLNLTVMPKQGRILLWPSVLDRAPNGRDRRTHHQALPVEKGIKYGANAWVHQRDFKTPHASNCH